MSVPRGLTARISGFHPEGPGSTPGVGSTFSYILTYIVISKKKTKERQGFKSFIKYF